MGFNSAFKGLKARYLERNPASVFRHKMAQRLFEEDKRVVWKEVRILETETNTLCRKYMEVAHVSCLQNPIGQPSTEI
jgi:hypothetical protein